MFPRKQESEQKQTCAEEPSARSLRRDASGMRSSASWGGGSDSSTQSSCRKGSVASKTSGSISSISSRSTRGDPCAVFVSHTGQDGAPTFAAFLARELDRELQQDGLFAFFDASSITAATYWETVIERNVEKCTVFVCVITRNYFRRYWTLRELDLAIETGKIILPVLYDHRTSFDSDLKVMDALYEILRGEGHDDAYDLSRKWAENIAEVKRIQGIRKLSLRKDREVLFIDHVVVETKKIIFLEDSFTSTSSPISPTSTGRASVHLPSLILDCIDENADLPPSRNGIAVNSNAEEAPDSKNHKSAPRKLMAQVQSSNFVSGFFCEDEDMVENGIEMKPLLSSEDMSSNAPLELNPLSQEEAKCKVDVLEIARNETRWIAENEGYIREFESDDYGIVHSPPVACGLPHFPWAIYYRQDRHDYVRVEYNAILRRTTARIVKFDKKQYGNNPIDPISWEIPPTVWVEDVPHHIYDGVNRSRVVARENWMFVTCACMAFIHFVTCCIGFAFQKEFKDRASWLMVFEVLAGTSLRIGCIGIARYWNNGSNLQVAMAIVSPMFWCLSYAGRRASTMGRWWRSPMWVRHLAATICFVSNVQTAFLSNAQRELNDIAGTCWMVIALLGSFHFYHLCHLKLLQEWFAQPGAYVPPPDFIMGVGFAHSYVIITHLAFWIEHGGTSLWMVLMVGPLLAETVILGLTGEKLRSVLEKTSLPGRYNLAGQDFSLLAGTTMVVSLTSGLEEYDTESDGIRRIVPLTWVVRGKRAATRLGASGAWQSANMLLPGRCWRNCRLETREVVKNVGDGVSIHVLMLRRAAGHDDVDSCGNSTVALGPALTDYFHRKIGDDVCPSTYQEKHGVGFVRAVGGGIIAMPVI